MIFLIVITGAASGMGLSTAHLLASRGAHLSLADVNENGLKTALSSLPHNSNHIHTVVDVRESTSVESWISATIRRYGKLDGAVNMAGVIMKGRPVTEMTDEEWDFEAEVNARGIFYCLRRS